MGEEAEWGGDIAKDMSASGIAKDRGLSACINVGENAKGEVKAGKKGGSEPNYMCRRDDGAVDFERQGGNGLGHVDTRRTEEFMRVLM
jgi:streptogramin lyase